MRKPAPLTAPPIKYLLECPDGALGNFELAKLGEVANLRSEMIALFDRLVDTSAQAVLAAWLRTIDRQELVKQLLESSTVTIEHVMERAKAEIRNGGRTREEVEEYEKMPSPWLVRPHMTPEEAKQARKASVRRWQEHQNAAGKCRKCSEPLCRESVEYCEKHLAMRREAQRRRRNGTAVHGRGQHPNTLASLRKLAAERKKTRREHDGGGHLCVVCPEMSAPRKALGRWLAASA